MFSLLGLTTMRGLVTGWVVSAVALVAGLALVLVGTTGIGVVLFVLGAIGSVLVTWGMLRFRSGLHHDGRSTP